MINFRLILWFLDYVTNLYEKSGLDDFDAEVHSVLEDIWNLKKQYNEIIKDLPF